MAPYAAADLGIAGSDVAGIGTITGQSLSGDSLQKHFFIENATFQASVAGTASQVNATADLGAVALQMANGSGTIQAQGIADAHERHHLRSVGPGA